MEKKEFRISRRTLFGSAGLLAAAPAAASLLPPGKTLRVHPILAYETPVRRERASWRGYGDIQTIEAARQEAVRIAAELKTLAARADFPVEFLPLGLTSNNAETAAAMATECDARLIFAAGGQQVYRLVEGTVPKVLFIRHKSGPYYLWHEIVHWRLLRRNGDTVQRDDVGLEDVVVDQYDEVLWRLRALYGLRNALGTRMLAIGGLVAYSKDGQENGPGHAREVWQYRLDTITEAEFARRLSVNRDDPAVRAAVEEQTTRLLALPNLKLATGRKYVFNSLMGWWTVKELLKETGAANFGFGRCMNREVIEVLDTPPCLLLSLANDEGYTAFCHTDLTHTTPGVLLRWISGKPSFVCNSHLPHDGLFTVAHCQAPRRMNGRDYEAATIMTHYESDYGAAVRVNYPKGQIVTVIVPNLRCTLWQGFRGKIVDTPNHPTCRSQMDIAVDGDWRELQSRMQGFHTQVCYGDYLREVGYALKKLGRVEWQCFSAPAPASKTL